MLAGENFHPVKLALKIAGYAAFLRMTGIRQRTVGATSEIREVT
jgi:hypothetical protein